MTMNFASAEARKVSDAAVAARELRLTQTAELYITQLVEPEIIHTASYGERVLLLPFHETQQEVYDRVAELLVENGYTASTEWPRICKKPQLVISW